MHFQQRLSTSAWTQTERVDISAHPTRPPKAFSPHGRILTL